MKKRIFVEILLFIFGIYVLFLYRPVKASDSCNSSWDVRGTYVIYSTCIYNCEGTWIHAMKVEEMSLASGSFSGSGYFVPDIRWTWGMEGSVVGSDIEFKVTYNKLNKGYWVEAEGKIGEDGEISGTAISSLGEKFKWKSIVGLANIPRCGKVTLPGENEVFSGLVNFEAYLVDNDRDEVQWAVEQGVCDKTGDVVIGNIEDFSNDYLWEYDEKLHISTFRAKADTCDWQEGSYCFVFEVKKDIGESDFSLRREFSVDSCDVNKESVSGVEDKFSSGEELMKQEDLAKKIIDTGTVSETEVINSDNEASESGGVFAKDEDEESTESGLGNLE